jgi:hypothetical protein
MALHGGRVWPKRQRSARAGGNARLKVALVAAASKSLRLLLLDFSQYTVKDLVAISTLYLQDFGILLYVPLNNNILLLYTGKVQHPEKLISSSQKFEIMLRHSYPNKFWVVESNKLGEYSGLYCCLCVSVPTELSPHCSLGTFLILLLLQTANAIGGANFPHISQSCLPNYLYTVDSAPCNVDAKNCAPDLQFSSFYFHTKILPQMVAMPMLICIYHDSWRGW